MELPSRLATGSADYAVIAGSWIMRLRGAHEPHSSVLASPDVGERQGWGGMGGQGVRGKGGGGGRGGHGFSIRKNFEL